MGNARGSRVCLARDEELRACVGVLEQCDESCTSIQGNARNAGAGVSNPVGLAERGRGSQEQSLALELVELVRERASLADSRSVVITVRVGQLIRQFDYVILTLILPGVYAGEREATPARASVYIISWIRNKLDKNISSPIEHVVRDELHV